MTCLIAKKTLTPSVFYSLRSLRSLANESRYTPFVNALNNMLLR